MLTKRVIAVAGPAGAGKSSLVLALAKRLREASIVQFDHYEQLTAQSPADLTRWVREGGDFDAFAVPQLRSDLERLKRGESIVDPRKNTKIVSKPYILFEMPLGRAYTPTAELIDFLIWIDLPLDIALARKIREFTQPASGRSAPEAQTKLIGWLDGFLGNYLSVVHDVLTIQRTKVRPHADLIVDGCASPEDQAALAVEALARAFPR